MFKIDSIRWVDGFTDLPQIRRDFPEYKWIAIDGDGEVVIYEAKPRWDDDYDWWEEGGDSFGIADCTIIKGHAKDTLRRL